MKAFPKLSTSVILETYVEMISYRRTYCDDSEYFKASQFWTDMCSDIDTWKIKKYSGNESEDWLRKAGVITLREHVTLSTDRQLFENAEKGCKLSNFILAHEFAHVALGHHDRNLVTKHFQLFAGSNGMSNIPPTVEEYQANLGAVFFQCGVALEDERLTTLDLAHRSFSDVSYVRRAQKLVQLSLFKQKLFERRSNVKRVVL